MNLHPKYDSKLTSSAYTGHVVHVRQRPRTHRLCYRVFYLLLDLAELPELDRDLNLFSFNRTGLFSFHEKDHGPRDGSSLRSWIDAQLAEAGITISGGRVSILCLPRILGYVFNPISVFFCFDRDGQIRAALYEVSNTFRESHTYLLPVDHEDGSMIDHAFDKALYVSPFISMACRYAVKLRRPDAHASITIRESDENGELLVATFRGAKTRLNDRFLLSTLVRFPLLTLKVMIGIHWDALKIWFKGTPVFPHPVPPPHTVSIIKSPESSPDVRVHTN